MDIWGVSREHFFTIFLSHLVTSFCRLYFGIHINRFNISLFSLYVYVGSWIKYLLTYLYTFYTNSTQNAELRGFDILFLYSHCVDLFSIEGLADPDARDKCLLSLISTLPPSNYATVIFMLDHLVRYAMACESFNVTDSVLDNNNTHMYIVFVYVTGDMWISLCDWWHHHHHHHLFWKHPFSMLS